MRRAEGYLTAYMTMSMGVLLSLVLALTVGAYRNTVRTEAEMAFDISLQSIFAEYHRELWDRYGLLGMDTSYGTAQPSATNAAEHLRYYLEENLAQDRLITMRPDVAELTAYEFYTDRDGQVFKEQVMLYMRNLTGIDTLETLFDEYTKTGPTGIFTTDYSQSEKQNREQISSWPTPTRTETKVNEDGEEVEEEIEVPIENPAGAIGGMRTLDQLPLVVDDVNGLSSKAVLLQDYVSYRMDICTGTGMDTTVRQSLPSIVVDEMLYETYLVNHFGYYGHTGSGCGLDYQLEYLLAGRDTDRENLAAVVNRLLIVREAANVAYLLTDAAKQAEMDAMAAGVAAVALVPELQPVLKLAILFGWAYLESLQDVRNLLLGGKVPLVKTTATWRCGLMDILTPGSIRLGKDDAGGLDYKSYLICLLLMQDEETKLFRTMDLCEMDLRLTSYNENFRIDGCIAAAQAHVVIDAGTYSCDITRTYSYQ